MTRRGPALGVVTFLLLLAAGSLAQEPPLAFPTEIEQVTVDVVVMNEKGQPITDLETTDIEVYEDGVLQATTSFDTFEVAAPPAGEAAAPPAGRDRVSSNTEEKEVQGRTFVIVFDDLHITVDTVGQARAAVAEFLTSETSEGDQITLVAPGAGVWWSTRMMAGREELLETLDTLEGLLEPDKQPDRLSDYEAMRIHNYSDSQVLRVVHRKYAARGAKTVWQTEGASDPALQGMSNEDPFVSAKALRTYADITPGNQATLGVLERALHSLVSGPGRKSVVLVSEGFIHDPKLEEFERIATASMRANAAIYFLSTLGLQGASGRDVTEEALNSEGSVSLARDSGGFSIRDSGGLAPGLRRIADDSRACYLIGYNPANTRRDGKFREIEVRVPGRADVEVRARRGYWVPSEKEVASEEEPGEDADLQRGLDSPWALDDIGLRVTHFVEEETSPGTARVSVAAEVDPGDLGFESQEGEDVAVLQFAMVAMSRDGSDHFRHDQKVDLKLTPEMRSELARTWLPIIRDFELEAGSYRTKVVLKDGATGRLGTVIHDFEVPEINPLRLRVSTPVLSDVRAPAEDGRPGDRLAILARREFAPEAALYCRFEVYGAARIEGSGRSRVTMAYEVRRSDGLLYTREAASPVEPSSDGVVSRTFGFPLRAAPPGEYAIVMRVKDGLSGKTVDLREPFTVTGPAVPTSPAEAP